MRIIPFRIKSSEEEDNYSDVYAFLIQGTKKDAYEVEIDIDSLNDLGITDTRCTCPHHTFRQAECKHIKECVKILGCFGIKTKYINNANNTQLPEEQPDKGNDARRTVKPEMENGLVTSERDSGVVDHNLEHPVENDSVHKEKGCGVLLAHDGIRKVYCGEDMFGKTRHCMACSVQEAST